MPERKRPNEKIHMTCVDLDTAMCTARHGTPTVTRDWRLVTCMSCLCDIVDVIRAKIERVMDAPWGEGKRSLNVKRKRKQPEGVWDE